LEATDGYRASRPSSRHGLHVLESGEFISLGSSFIFLAMLLTEFTASPLVAWK
jgi:hypothetical protein